MHIPSADRSVIASLKTISADGSFEQNQQLRCDEAPVSTLIAVIDVNVSSRPSTTVPDDVMMM
jgi:hypothetical protein